MLQLDDVFEGVVVVVAIAIGLSAILNLADKGVPVIGVLPQGFLLASFPIVKLFNLPILFAAA